MENYSLSDIAAASGNEGLGGNSWIVLIILFAMIFGWGGNGFGKNTSDFGQYATAASQTEILLGQQFQSLDNKIDRIGNGIADATFSLNNSITGEGRAIQTQLADCCCSNQRNIDSVRFDMANYAASIRENDTANTQKVLDAISQNKIESLQSQLSNVQNQLALQNAMCGVPKINPYMYGIVPTYSGCNCGTV